MAIVLRAFPGHYRDRAEAIEAEERDSRLDTPIFICLLSFPGIPTYLHFFEPRYVSGIDPFSALSGVLMSLPRIPDIDSCSAGASSHPPTGSV
jgi:hypothetical protein